MNRWRGQSDSRLIFKKGVCIIAFHKNCLFQIVVTRKPLIVQKWRSEWSCRESIGHSKKNIHWKKIWFFFSIISKWTKKIKLKKIQGFDFFLIIFILKLLLKPTDWWLSHPCLLKNEEVTAKTVYGCRQMIKFFSL